MSVFVPSVIGIRTTQTFGKLLDSDTNIQIRDNANWYTLAVSVAELNYPVQISIVGYPTVAYDQPLDFQLRFKTDSASWNIAYFEAILPADGTAGFFIGPYPGGDAEGANADFAVRHVPLLSYYPASNGLFVSLRTTLFAVAPTTGTLTLAVFGWY
jgi:hypothetical protein